MKKLLFCFPIKKNDSLVIYPSPISANDMIARNQHLNVITSAGEAVRKAILLEQDYGLENMLCDKTDLKDSWNKTSISEVLATFISSFMQIK